MLRKVVHRLSAAATFAAREMRSVGKYSGKTFICSNAVILMIVGTVQAQGQNAVKYDSNALIGSKVGQSTGKTTSHRSGSDQTVTLRLQDSSITSAIYTISRMAHLPVLFNSAHPAFKRKVTVNVVDSRVLDAIALTLQGTGFIAKFADDGRTILIGHSNPRKDSVASIVTGSVRGSVTDSSTKKPVAGVTVTISSSKASTVTNADGIFLLSGISAGDHVISIKSLGYRSEDVRISVAGNKVSSATILLVSSALSLSEIVTTATGPQRRVDISNDVVKIDAARMMESAPVRSVTDLLQAAQIGGVTITPSSGEPGAPKRIRIGGVGSISQNNDPVVIIDGVWVKSSFSTQDVARQLGSNSAPGGYLPSRLDAIDPNTIETIEIVRGPAAATLYGPDAANGVIMITTKRGSAGPARWDLHYSYDIKNPVGNYPMEYEGVGRTPYSSEPRSCTAYDIAMRVCVQDSLLSWSKSDPLLRNERRGSTNQFTASVNGGSSQVRYSLSAGLSDMRGTRTLPRISQARAGLLSLPIENRYRHPSEMRDRRLSTRLDIAAREGLDFSLSLEGSQQNTREDALNLVFTNIGRLDSGAVLLKSGTTSLEKKGARTTRGLVSLVTRWNPYTWTLITTTLGIDKEVQREARIVNASNCSMGICIPASVNDESAGRDGSVYTIRAHSSFTPSLGWASRFLAVQPGITFDLRRQVNYRHSASAFRQTDSVVMEGDFTDGPTNALGGLSLNANIRLFNRISFDPAIRHDFSGAKELKNNSKSYPRFGTSWLVSDESFFPQTPWLTTLRLRGAFGYASVQPNLSQLYGKYIRHNINLTGTQQPIIQLSGVGNPNLQPERSSEFEVGFDADMLDDRMTLTLTYANKQNRNTLINRPLAPSAGVSSGARQENIAKVVNQSTMIQAIVRPIETNNVRVRLTSNFTFSFNEIKSLGSGVSPFGTFEQRYVAGYPVGGLWSRPVMGILDRDGDGYIVLGEMVFADSMAYMGSNMPRHTMGHNIEVGFLNNFTFNAFVDYKGPFTQNRTISSRSLRGYWDATASVEEQMLPSIISRMSGSSQDLQTVTELRLQSASISMNVPSHIVRRLGVQSLHIALQGSNLGLWSKYRGRDPGVNSTPIGERLTDASNAIGLPRNYSIQFRVRY